jgi:3-hydroxybutyrate dehydrogenase
VTAPPSTGELEGRVAVVTGAAGGLGRAVCEVFEREGASVLPVDLAGEGCYAADVGTTEGNRAMVQQALAAYGKLDTLVLNAGIQHLAPIAEFPEPAWDRLFDVLVKGPHLAIKVAWPHLTSQPGGRVVVTASALSVLGEEYKAAYVSAKHAVVGLVKVAALEGGRLGLCANAVAPGLMWTGLMERQLEDQARLRNISREDVVRGIERSQPVRAVTTHEVAELISFLASDRASGISGTCVPVDLGFLVA